MTNFTSATASVKDPGPGAGPTPQMVKSLEVNPPERPKLAEARFSERSPEAALFQILCGKFSPSDVEARLQTIAGEPAMRAAMVNALNQDDPWILRQDLELRAKMWAALRPYAHLEDIQLALFEELRRGQAFPKACEQIVEIVNSIKPISSPLAVKSYLKLIADAEASNSQAELLKELRPTISDDIKKAIVRNITEVLKLTIENGHTPSEVLLNGVIALADESTLQLLKRYALGTAQRTNDSLGVHAFSTMLSLVASVAGSIGLSGLLHVAASANPDLAPMFTIASWASSLFMGIFGFQWGAKLIRRSFSEKVENLSAQTSVTKALGQVVWHPEIRKALIKLAQGSKDNTELAALAKESLNGGDFSKLNDKEILNMFKDTDLHSLLKEPVSSEFKRRKLSA